MELRTCVFCGTEYDKSHGRCPVCGKGDVEAEPQGERKRRTMSSSSGARVAPRGKKRAQSSKKQGGSQLGWAVACILLGIGVLAGIVVFFSTMSFFEEGFDFNAIPTLLSANPEYDYDAQDQLELEQQIQQNQQPEQLPEQQTPAASVVTDPDSKACTALTINQNAVPLDEIGAKVFLTAVARPSDCEDPILFSSTNEAVVTVTEGGMLTAVGPGVADVLVTCGSITQVCTVTCDFVSDIPEEDPDETTDGEHAMKLNLEDFTLFSPGEEAVLSVEHAPEDAVITYQSSDSQVASVDEKGVVTAVKAGQATITVTVNGETMTCIVRCNLEKSAEDDYTGPFAVKNEYGSTGDATFVRSGESCTLTLKDANGKEVSGLTWATSNGAVCSVDANGKVTATGAGMATVSTVFGGETYKFTIRCNF